MFKIKSAKNKMKCKIIKHRMSKVKEKALNSK